MRGSIGTGAITISAGARYASSAIGKGYFGDSCDYWDAGDRSEKIKQCWEFIAVPVFDAASRSKMYLFPYNIKNRFFGAYFLDICRTGYFIMYLSR